MKIEDGYYWVKTIYSKDWQPAERDGEIWWILGMEEDYTDSQIVEVGGRIREPKEKGVNND